MPYPTCYTFTLTVMLLAALAVPPQAGAQAPGESDLQQIYPAVPERESADDLEHTEFSDAGDDFGYRSKVALEDRRRLPSFGDLGFRHSATHGRWSGPGEPLRGTSWLNRPYEFGLDAGGFVMTKRISANSQRNNDVLAAAHLGWDWDHYWGSQVRVAWTSPDLSTPAAVQPRKSDDLMIYDLSMLYYPWGDSRVRPYYRFGAGLVDVDFTNPAGHREDNMLLTFPVGIGIKYQTKRWMALRGEVIDYITFGQNSAAGMQNLTFSLGMEWRFGGRPTNVWSSPSHRRAW